VQLKQALTAAVEYLESSDCGSPRMNAETLMMFVLGVNRAYLYAHPERELTKEEHERYDTVVQQRASGVPSQYITGHQEFWGLDFIVAPAVLIPRPETEHLVETVLELAKGVERPRIVDVGTGTGCIALALAHELKGAEIYAVDVSAEALEIARANAARLQLDRRVKLLQCDVLTPIPQEGIGCHPERSEVAPTTERSRRTPFDGTKFHELDFVVSNPPYVGHNEAAKVQRSVFEYEPRMAVFAGEHGLDVIRPLIDQAYTALKPGGWLAMEIGYSMRDAVIALLNATLWDELTVVPDLQGIPRVVAARKR
jgi:release factor glutamine methyltransferase